MKNIESLHLKLIFPQRALVEVTVQPRVISDYLSDTVQRSHAPFHGSFAAAPSAKSHRKDIEGICSTSVVAMLD